MSECIFTKGLYVKKKEDSPAFVIADLSIELEEFITFAKQHAVEGKLRVNLLMSKAGKPYSKLDSYNMNRDKENAMQQQEETPQPPPPVPSFGAVDKMTQPAVQPSFTPVEEPKSDIPF